MNLDRVMERPRLRGRAVVELMSAYLGQLLKYLTAEELELALLRNSLENSKVCHLHDYADINQLMINAWDFVFEASANDNWETLDIQNDDHLKLINEARDRVHSALTGALV